MKNHFASPTRGESGIFSFLKKKDDDTSDFESLLGRKIRYQCLN